MTTINKHTVPIKSGWPNFDVLPPRPEPHWSYDPSAEARQKRVNRQLYRAFAKAVDAAHLRRLAMAD